MRGAFMAAEQPETDAFLAVIEKKIAALQALAESYKAALALGALGPGDDTSVALSGVTATAQAGSVGVALSDMPTGIFMDKSMPAAIKLLLGTTRRKHTPKEVAAALKEGGFESTSQNFEKIVATTMHRMKSEGGELLQFKDGWGLAELYPESLRIRISKEAKDAKPTKPRRNARKSPQRKGATAKPKETASAHVGPKPVAVA
jgi:hypothetical protein